MDKTVQTLDQTDLIKNEYIEQIKFLEEQCNILTEKVNIAVELLRKNKRLTKDFIENARKCFMAILDYKLMILEELTIYVGKVNRKRLSIGLDPIKIYIFGGFLESILRGIRSIGTQTQEDIFKTVIDFNKADIDIYFQIVSMDSYSNAIKETELKQFIISLNKDSPLLITAVDNHLLPICGRQVLSTFDIVHLKSKIIIENLKFPEFTLLGNVISMKRGVNFDIFADKPQATSPDYSVNNHEFFNKLSILST